MTLAAIWLIRPAFGKPPSLGLYDVIEIQPNVFVWQPEDLIYQTGDPRFSRAASAGFVITPKGVVVINTTNNPLNARDLLYEIRQRANVPVTQVIDTDWRGDHVLGNEVFVDVQATIVSTAAAKDKMQAYQRDLEERAAQDPRIQARMRGIHFSPPTQTFDGQTELGQGNETIKVIDVGKGALAGTAVVYLTEAKVVFLGGLFDNEMIPEHGLDEISAWLETLRQVESLDATTFVPDRGPLGDRVSLIEFREFLEWVANQNMPANTVWRQNSNSVAARMAKAHE